MKPDAVAIGIGVLALAGAALFVRWLGEQPAEWSVVKAAEAPRTSAAPGVVPVTPVRLIEEQ